MIKAVFFDLDGTLLPMDEPEFRKIYLGGLGMFLANFGYDSKKVAMDILQGSIEIIKNDGSKLNEDVFWDHLISIYGDKIFEDKPKFDIYYEKYFNTTFKALDKNPLATKIVEFCRENVEYVLLTTNPFFPLVATSKRMEVVGLTPSMFDKVTTYENSYFCKPNPKYFKSILEEYNLKPEEVILVGNNTYEDGDCAAANDIKCVILKEGIIRDPNTKGTYDEISINDLIDYLKDYINKNK